MTYDAWKTRSPDDDIEQPTGDEPSELDAIYEMLHAAETHRDEYKAQLEYARATIDRLTAERDALRKALEETETALDRSWMASEREEELKYMIEARRVVHNALATLAVSDAES